MEGEFGGSWNVAVAAFQRTKGAVDTRHETGVSGGALQTKYLGYVFFFVSFFFLSLILINAFQRAGFFFSFFFFFIYIFKRKEADIRILDKF